MLKYVEFEAIVKPCVLEGFSLGGRPWNCFYKN